MSKKRREHAAARRRRRLWIRRRARAEYFLSRPLIWLSRLLPEGLSIGFAQAIADLLYFLLARRRRIGQANLSLAFPELSPAERSRLLRRSYRNLGRTVVESLRLHGLTDRSIQERICYAPGSIENLLEAERLGKGVIFITAHLGNWELLAIAHSLAHSSFCVVAKPLRNSFFNEELRRLRARGGNTICERGNTSELKRLIRQLRSGGTVGLLVDQCPRHGIKVPFFGADTLCDKGPAALALKTSAAIVPAFIRRNDRNGRHTILFAPRLRFDELRCDEAGVVQLTARLQELLESEIRRRPEDWLWIHRRWKRTSSLTYPVSHHRRRKRAIP